MVSNKSKATFEQTIKAQIKSLRKQLAEVRGDGLAVDGTADEEKKEQEANSVVA